MGLTPEQLAEIRKLKTDLESIFKELSRVDNETAKLIVKERTYLNDMETLRKQVSRLADFYYDIEERLNKLFEEIEKLG